MAFHSLVVVLILLAAEIKTVPAPRYDPGSVVDLPVTVTEIRDVAGENGLNGIRLLARTEADAPIDVYLGPSDFVKGFEITFVKGDRIQIIGSKIKLASGTIVLAREVRKGSETLYLRDKNGDPFWHLGK
jgi:hypothetical protein